MKLLPILGFAVALSVLAAPAGAAASPDGWYLGGALGSVNVDSSAVQTGSEGTSFHLFGGYQFTGRVALEAGYVDFGDLRLRSGPLTGIERFRVRATGFTFAVAGQIPLRGAFDLEAKLGAFVWDGNASVPGISTEPGTIHPTGALSFNWRASDLIAVTAGWTRYHLGVLNNDVLGVGMKLRLTKNKG